MIGNYPTLIAARLAHEGVPVRAIARSLGIPSDEIRDTLQECIDVGGITDMPKDDWPPGQRRADRLPAILPHEMSEKEMLFACQRALKLTRLEASFMIVLLKKNAADKDTLHHVVEAQREARRTRPDDPEPTDPKMVDVVICKLRKKLAPHKIVITTLWGRGYFIDEQGRQRSREVLLSAHEPGA